MATRAVLGLHAPLHLPVPGAPSPAQGCAATVAETVPGPPADASPNCPDARGKRVFFFSGAQQVEGKRTLQPHVGETFPQNRIIL